MKATYIMAAMTLIAAMLTGCKTDSEEDILDNNEGGGTTAGTAVVINEICGKQDPDDDWVEFYNTSDKETDLGGSTLVKTDEDGKDETIYTFPAGKKVGAHDYLVVATTTGELQAGISNSKEVGLRLVMADGKTADRFDRDSDIGKDISHEPGGSYARIPDGTGKWTVTSSATRGKANSEKQEGQLVINEICGKQDPDDDWMELYNGTSSSLDLGGFKIIKTDEEGQSETIYTFPEGKKIASNGYLVIATLTGELQAGISNKKEVAIELVSKDGKSIDKFDRDVNIGKDISHDLGGSYARIPDGTGDWKVVTTATRGTKNK